METVPDLTNITAAVRKAAREQLLPRFASVKRELKSDGSIVTVADRAMQEHMRVTLAESWPEFQLLGEEMSPVEQADLMANPRAGLWVLDPLDGTSNFTAGLPFFSVSLALLIGGKPVLGVVYDPERDECFSARRNGGAWLNGEPLGNPTQSLPLKGAIAAVDFKRLPSALARRLAENPPYASQRSLGSVALDWCWLAAGRFHVYLHGKQKIWDYAAGQLVLSEAGGYSCTLDDEPVFRLGNEPRSALAALERGLYEEWHAWILGGTAEPSATC